MDGANKIEMQADSLFLGYANTSPDTNDKHCGTIQSGLLQIVSSEEAFSYVDGSKRNNSMYDHRDSHFAPLLLLTHLQENG